MVKNIAVTVVLNMVLLYIQNNVVVLIYMYL
jgi:hypothetical protein